MKKTKKLKIIITLIILFSIICGAIYISIKYSNGIEFTQLSQQSSRQMMGYVIKEKQNLIIVDGGTEQDSENLKKYVNNYNNGIINYWIVTHAHDDHIGAMVSLLEQDKVKIENIICSLNNLEWYEQYDTSRTDIVERLYKILEAKSEINIKEVNLNE